MGRPSKHTAAEVVEAIKGSGGIKVAIAQKLGVARDAVDRYLAKYESARIAYENELEVIGDIAESVVIMNIRDQRNIETAKWYIKMKLARRGYVEKQQIEHSGATEIILKWDEDADSDDQAAEDAPGAEGDIQAPGTL